VADAEIIDISSPGWDGVNAESPLPLEYAQTEQAEIDRSVSRVLESDDGQRMFGWLKAAYLEQPTWAPGYDTDYGFFREGQNTLIREIEHRASRAKEQ
jgi:hypothetical protein